MFADFWHESEYGFHCLPENYRVSTFFTLDEEIVTQESRPTATHEYQTDIYHTEANKLEFKVIPVPSRLKKATAERCRELLSQMRSLTYIVEDADTLKEVQESLETCLQKMATCAPKAINGIVLEQKASNKSATTENNRTGTRKPPKTPICAPSFGESKGKVHRSSWPGSQQPEAWLARRSSWMCHEL